MLSHKYKLKMIEGNKSLDTTLWKYAIYNMLTDETSNFLTSNNQIKKILTEKESYWFD